MQYTELRSAGKKSIKNGFYIYILKTLIMGTRRGGYNEYSQSMYWIKNKENRHYPCKPQFYRIKVGYDGVGIHFTDMSP